MDDRRIVRCWHCLLRQFETRDRHCRRCHEPLYLSLIVAPPPPPEPVEPMYKPQPTWGNLLRQIRQERGLSQKQLAVKSGMVRTFVSKLERRPGPPTMATALRLAGALDVPAYVLTNVETAYDYYCTRLLVADPLIESISHYVDRLSPEQRIVIADTVRSLAQHHQMSFTEWEPIPLAALEGRLCLLKQESHARS